MNEITRVQVVDGVGRPQDAEARLYYVRCVLRFMFGVKSLELFLTRQRRIDEYGDFVGARLTPPPFDWADFVDPAHADAILQDAVEECFSFAEAKQLVRYFEDNQSCFGFSKIEVIPAFSGELFGSSRCSMDTVPTSRYRFYANWVQSEDAVCREAPVSVRVIYDLRHGESGLFIDGVCWKDDGTREEGGEGEA